MKNLVIIVVVALFTISVNAQKSLVKEGANPKATTDTTQEADPNAPVIKFESQTIDYGIIDKGSDGTREFKFTNTGKSPLKIKNVKSTCGCTIPTYPKKEIMPGESGVVSVKYNTNRAGRFSKSVSIFTNTVPERSVLRIKGEVNDPNKSAPIQKEKNMLEIK